MNEFRKGSIVRLFLATIFLISTINFYGQYLKNLNGKLVVYLTPFILLPFFHHLKLKIADVFLAITAILTIYVCKLVNGSGWGSLYNNIYCIIMVLLFSSLTFKINDFKFWMKLVFIFNGYLCLYIIFNYNIYIRYIGVYNPNTIAAMLLICALFTNLYLYTIVKKRIFLLLYNIIIFSFMLLCLSRSALLAYTISLIFLCFVSYKEKYKILLKISFWIIGMLGYVLPVCIVYFYMHQNIPFIKYLDNFFVKNFKKNLFTGREHIWNSALKNLAKSMENMLFGIGSHYSFDISETYGSNFHNSFFTIIICAGFLGYFLILLLIYRFFRKVLNRNNMFAQKICCFYISLLALGLFESIVFSSYYCLLGFLMLSFGLCEYTSDLKEKDEKKLQTLN